MQTKKCLVPECKEETHSRGLCYTCYHFARRLIVNKDTTWEKLENNGKCLSRKRKHTKRKQWILS